MRSIRNKISLSVFFLLVLFAGTIAFIWYRTNAQNAERAAIEYVSEIIRISNERLEETLKEMSLVVSLIALDQGELIVPLLAQDYESNSQRLADMRTMEDLFLRLSGAFNRYFSALQLVGFDGVEFGYGTVLPHEALRAEDWYDDILAAGNATIFIPPHYNQPTGGRSGEIDYRQMVLSVVRPVYEARRPIGFVKGDIWCDVLLDTFSANLPYGGTIAIADTTTGETIFRPDDDDLAGVVADTAVQTLSTQSALYATVRGREYLVVTLVSDYTRWTTIGFIPKDTLLADFARTGRTALAISLLFCLAALVMTFGLSSFISRDIVTLNKIMQTTGEYDLSIPAAIRSRDEVGELFGQFEAMIGRIQRLVVEVKESERQKRNAEIEVLQNQINPHFLQNTLTTINFLASLKGAENIRRVTDALSSLLHVAVKRDTLFITVEEEMHCLRSYLYIQEFKYANKFEVTFDVEPAARDLLVVKFLIQPLVENALIHGIAAKEGSGRIVLQFFVDGERLRIRVKDDGVGVPDRRLAELRRVLAAEAASLPTTAAERGEGAVGLLNVARRIRAHFGDAYGVTILSEEHRYTEVEVAVPRITVAEVSRYV